MRSFLVLCVAAALATGVCGDCDACLDGRCYKKHLLPGAEGRSGAIDRNTNTLYVVDKKYQIKQCNLDTATCRDTAQQWYISAVAVDQRTGDIYGTVEPRRGIYKLDLANNKSVLIDPNASVSSLAYKDKLYYAQSGGGIFTTEGGNSRIVAGTEGHQALSLLVDKQDDIYFKTVFNFVHLTRATGKISEWDSQFTGTVDKNGDATFIDWLKNAVYRVTNGQLVEVGAVKDPTNYYETLFDRDNNVIYIESIGSYHLKQVSNARCTVDVAFGYRTITET